MEYLYTEKFKKILKNAELEKLNDYGLKYDSFKECLINYIGKGNLIDDYNLYTPLLRNIIDNAFKYSDNNFIDENNLFFSFYFSEEGIAKSILKIMNIDLFKILKI